MLYICCSSLKMLSIKHTHDARAHKPHWSLDRLVQLSLVTTSLIILALRRLGRSSFSNIIENMTDVLNIYIVKRSTLELRSTSIFNGMDAREVLAFEAISIKIRELSCLWPETAQSTQPESLY
jgi:hypothetical protein